MHAIGKNFDTTLQYINDPSKSEYYIAPATPSMSPATLNTNYTALNSQIETFTSDLESAGNNAAQANLSQIISIKQQLADAYEALIEPHSTGPVSAGSPSLPATNTGASSGIGQNGLLIGAGIFVLLLLITRKPQKKKNKKRDK